MEKVKTALIASGGGTDAYAIMKSYKHGEIPNIDLRLLISTKAEAGCLEKAQKCGIPALTINRQDFTLASVFNRELKYVLTTGEIEMVFLVGCIVKIPAIAGIIFYNIHPANIETCGGKGMYGLEPHKKVLSDIADLIQRGRKTLNDKFYTEPTVHGVEDKYDSGQALLRLSVEIPQQIIYDFINNPESCDEAASNLQKHVLPYEWMMLPLAVKIAATQMQILKK